MFPVSRTVDILTDEPAKIGEKVHLKGKGVFTFTEERRFVKESGLDYEGSKIVDLRTRKCYVYHRGSFQCLSTLLNGEAIRPRIFFDGGSVVVVDGFGHVCHS